MNGWKTKTAAALSISFGVVGFFLGLHGINDGMQFVVTGLGLLGVGHKLDKIGGQ